MPKRFVPFSLILFCLSLWAGGLATPLVRAEGPAATEPAAATVYPFKRLLIADSESKAAALKSPPGAGIVFAQDVPFLATKEFADAIKPYLGQPITIEMVRKMASDVLNYMRSHDRFSTGIVVPSPQDITGGEVRLAVVLGRYKRVQFRGNRWFSSAQLESSLGLKPGDEVRLSTLEEAVNWTNANPFRRVKVVVNDLQNEPGLADLVVEVQELIPFRAAVSYDNTGNELLGFNRYSASVQFGNVWGLGHQASYQYTTTDDTRLYQVHSGDYRLPLPWHHYIQLAAAYSLSQPSFYNGLFTLKGQSLVTDLRYIAPVERGALSMEFSGGLDFKQANNNFEWAGTVVPQLTTKNDVFQLSLGATLVRRDTLGAWAIGANLSLSPGNVNARNSDATFASARPDGYVLIYDADGNPLRYEPVGQSRYAYGTLNVQRLTKLPGDFQILSHGQIQISSANLPGSEQMSIGGQGTVRGYDERISSGDQGYLLSHELQSPEWQAVVSLHGRKLGIMQTRLVAFWDFGKTGYKHSFGAIEQPLMGAGLGVRCNVANNFSLAADYGWQLIETTPPQPDHGRASIKATLAY
jgi:hemolysin activation/secretion protein